MNEQEKVESSAALADAISSLGAGESHCVNDFNLFVSPQPAEVQERRERLAKNRRQPDTSQRAWLQELAIAVADELELRAAVDERIDSEYAEADNAQQQAEQAAKDSAFAAEHPLEAAYDRAKGRSISRELWGRPMKDAQVLRWAIEKGLLPSETEKIPDTQAQFMALSRRHLREQSA